MSNLRIILNVFYEPTLELKMRIEQYKDILIPINGGSGLTDEWSSNNLMKDNVGDNISALNPLFNEMTSIYWVWKHYDEIGNPEYIGFNHYRRFFSLKEISKKRDSDILVANGLKFIISVREHYKIFHIEKDLDLLCEIIKQKNANMYNNFQKYLDQKVLFAPCNMFVMRKELFFEWCEFIFPILFELKEKINMNDGRDDYQKRAICFLCERLFGFWVTYRYSVSKNLRMGFLEIEAHKEYRDKNKATDNRSSKNARELYDKLINMRKNGKCLKPTIDRR